CFAHDYGPFDDVLQFAYVSGPRVRLEQLQSLSVDTPNVLARFAPIAIDEVFNEQGNIRPSCPQRRHLERKYVEPIIEVLAEGAVGDGSFQITIRGSDDGNVNADRLAPANSLEFPLL